MKENALKLFEFIIQQSKRKDLLIEESFNALADKMVELGFLYKDSKIEYIYWCSISPADIDKYKRITLDESIYDGYRVIHPLRIDDNKYFEYMLKIILKIIKRYGFFSKNIGKVISSMIIVIEQMIPFYNSYLVNKNIKNNKQKTYFGLRKFYVVEYLKELAYLTNSGYVGDLYIKYFSRYDLNFQDFIKVMVDSKKERGKDLADYHMYYYCLNHNIKWSCNIDKHLFNDIKESRFFKNEYFEEYQSICDKYLKESKNYNFDDEEYEKKYSELYLKYKEVCQEIGSLEIPKFLASLNYSYSQLNFFMKIMVQPLENFNNYNKEFKLNELKMLVDEIVNTINNSNLQSYFDLKKFDYTDLKEDEKSLKEYLEGIIINLELYSRIMGSDYITSLVENKAIAYYGSEAPVLKGTLDEKISDEYRQASHMTLLECQYVPETQYAEYNFNKYIEILSFEFDDLKGYTYGDFEKTDVKYFLDCYFEEINKRLSDFVIKNKEKYKELYADKSKVKKYITNFFKEADLSLVKKYGRLDSLEKEYLKIVNNTSLVEAIVSSQVFKEEFDQDKSIYSGFNGDYTNLLVGPIKAMERFLKEVLVKKYPRSVVVCDPKSKKMIPNLKLNVKLSAEDVSGAKGNLINPKIKTVLELGPVARLLADNLQNDSSYKGELFKLNPQNRFIFNDEFIQNIRNGHFHIHMVSTYDEAIDLYKQVSYFFRKCIDELDYELD